ncbi:hypothetical protein NB663_00110 [Vibrio parahaemolyticus]|uniref:hypothetical protein n=1 Tax=Vibrio parahaemolyticus TaxID=670 RepID=UPI00215C8498|nr:hypothetical protein [Vibrio parahaemolyticus]MCR9778954.1 hypothetical protein [Vibrio parahaemolyticus]
MIKWGAVLGVVIFYSVVIFFPFIELMLLTKYNVSDGCAFIESELYRITDNLLIAAYGGYYLSVILIVFVMIKFNRKKNNE